MLKPFASVALIAALIGMPSFAREWMCAGGTRGLAPIDSAAYRKYAPDRFVDVVHMVIEVTPNFPAQSVAGRTAILFKPLTAGQMELRLNAQDLRISAVTGSVPIQHFENTGSELVITFREKLAVEKEQEVVVTHEAFPRKGMYFRTRGMGYAPEDEHLFTQGEDIEARHWFPCYDAPNDKFTNDLICHIPEGMTALSNGRLVGEKVDGKGMKAVHWRQDKPHTSYLISLVAGYFRKIEDKYGDVPMAFYTPTSQIELARNSFEGTREMMAFFEQEIGVPYPWDKYDQVCVQDFMWGGMENTSITTLTDNTLFPNETENIHSSEGLVAHELAHQWFGDLVTCEEWSHIWLNEGFATYYAHLYHLHKQGRDAFLYGLYRSASGFINKPAALDNRPIVFRNYDDPIELFGYLVYPKGGWVLHMLRDQLGEELYRKCIRTYVERHKFGNVETHDLIEVVEQLSGRSFDQFFDQWVFHPHHPELHVRYEWDEGKKLAKMTVIQSQPLTNGVALFRFPLTLRFKGGFGATNVTADVKEKEETFYFRLESAPKIVRVDPDYVLLAKISFEPARDLVLAQLKDESDVMGRIFALQQLSKSKDQPTIDAISERLAKDPFYGVRIEAAEALRKIHSEEALKALIAHSSQEDARVRLAVAAEVGRFFEPAALQFTIAVLEKEANPEIRQVAVRSLGSFPSPETKQIILRELGSRSHEQMVASSAIAAARGQDNPGYIVPILEVLRRDPMGFSAGRYSAALESVAHLARNETNKEIVFKLLTEQVASPRRTVRNGAIRALGVLRDERALPILENLASGSDELAETGTATKALEAIRRERPIASELNNLRSEMLELKKQSAELKKSLEDLKKQNAVPPSAEASKKPESKKAKK